ncbi:hypothetical protein KM043_015968 [Ampulex compressa]|nr:hypothetical protein KM043_015968 [Ampulex compressa]
MKPHDHGIVKDDEGHMTISHLRRSWMGKDCLIVNFLEYLYGHRDVPGPISSEPVVVDGGRNWVSLSWGKAERRGPAPVLAYKVDAWLLGGDGGARWVELGITPINTFDAFNLRPGAEYKFRVTPRNRYGWGEAVVMSNSITVNEIIDLPEFTTILPGQLKALEGSTVKLEYEVRGDSKIEIKWYRETTEIDPSVDPRYSIYYNGYKCTLTIGNIKESDSGRYVCEASNRIGKVSSFARVLVVTDPKIIHADAKLQARIIGDESEDRPPQFTMRIRDRRVQATYPVRLTCQVLGNPIPQITWFKNDVEIQQDERHVLWDDESNFHTLEITHSSLDDSGCYMVTAKNTSGSVSCRSNLVVDKGIRAYVSPEFLYGLDAAYTVKAGTELRMSVQIEAYPSVGVVWHRDGIRLRPSRRAVMTLNHDGTAELSLANVTARDAGVYSCTATNEVGHAEIYTRVSVIGTEETDSSIEGLPAMTVTSPNIPYSKEPLFVTKPLSTEAVEGDTVIILCEVVGDPKPDVIWLRDFLKPDYYRDAPHFRLVGAGPQYQLEIPYAKLDFTGTYSVIARNCHGEAKAVISLQIYAKGQGKEEKMNKSGVRHGKVLTLPIVTRELRDLRCCDGDAVTLKCKVTATPEPPLVRWERGGKILSMGGDFSAEFDGEAARLCIQHVYPEDEGEYTCVAYNDLGKAFTSACIVVDVPEGKENLVSQRLTRPISLISAGSTPRSTPRSTPIRSLSPAISHGRELRSPQLLPRGTASKRPKICAPKFYAVPHNRVVEEGETVHFQCAAIGHPLPWVKWDKNGCTVTPSNRISVKERDDVKILEISEVTQEDAGLYRVTVENDFGRIEASARLEIINRYRSLSRTIRTRSASPRTYPSFDRSLLNTTTRINGHLQLGCTFTGNPSPTPTWYRNGRPLERSSRIKRYFDGKTMKIEISKVKASDGGEYTCVAKNVLGSTRNTCEVTVLDPHDPSTADKDPPKFLQPLPKDSVVMEEYCYELQARLTGTPPFSVTWLKNGREVSENDHRRFVIYGDGGIALRLSNVCPQDAGEYTCRVCNNFGQISCTGLFAVQDYKNASTLPPQFTKTPLSVITAKGDTACFCARVQCGKPMEIAWSINGKDVKDNIKCKVENNGDTSILRIQNVTSRDMGIIRCTASVIENGLSISCMAELRLQESFQKCLSNHANTQANSNKQKTKTSSNRVEFEKNINVSSSPYCRRFNESQMHTRSSSLPRRSNLKLQNLSAIPKRCISKSPINRKKSNTLSTNRFTKQDLDNAKEDKETTGSNLVEEVSMKDYENLLLSNKEEMRNALFSLETENDVTIDENLVYNNELALPVFSKTEKDSPTIEEHDDHKEALTASISRASRTEENEENCTVSTSENEHPMQLPVKKSDGKEFVGATVTKVPADITVFRGNRVILRVNYEGHPQPNIKWFRAVSNFIIFT